MFWVGPSLWVVMVGRGTDASGGWKCLPSLGETQCRRRPGRTVDSVSWRGCKGRHKAGVCGGRMRLAGRGRAGHLRFGTCYEYRHPVDDGCCRRGGVAGAEPPHKGGPNRPDRPEKKWSVVREGANSDTDLISRWLGLRSDLRHGEVRPHFGMHALLLEW